MTPAATPRDDAAQVYLSVIAWPEALSRDAAAGLLAQALGSDAATMRLRARQHEPVIIGLFERAPALRAVDALRAHGGEAFAPSLADVQSLGATLKIKDLRVDKGALDIDLWRGPGARVRPEDIAAIIRASLSHARADREASSIERTARLLTSRAAAGGYLAFGWAGAYGAAALFDSGYRTDAAAGSTPGGLSIAEKIDIHTRAGAVFQIDGEKFGWGALGELRGMSDNVNADRMCELLVHLAPGAVVDPYFSLWRPPAGVKRFRIPFMQINNDDPEFAFYSRWSALMYRRLLGDAPAESATGR